MKELRYRTTEDQHNISSKLLNFLLFDSDNIENLDMMLSDQFPIDQFIKQNVIRVTKDQTFEKLRGQRRLCCVSKLLNDYASEDNYDIIYD